MSRPRLTYTEDLGSVVGAGRWKSYVWFVFRMGSGPDNEAVEAKAISARQRTRGSRTGWDISRTYLLYLQ